MTQKTGSSNDYANASAGASNAGSDPTSKTSSGIEEIKGKVGHLATDLAGEAKKTAESKLGAGKDFAAEHLGSMAHALRMASKELHSNDSPAVGYVDSAARSVESLSDYFQTRTLSQLVGDIESYARREPAVFLGGAFFVGMLGGRFLKAASPARSTPPGGGAGQFSYGSSSTRADRALPSANRGGQSSAYGASKGNEGHGRHDKHGQSTNQSTKGGNEDPSRGPSGASASSPSSGSGSPSGASSSYSSSSSGTASPSSSGSSSSASGTSAKSASSPPGGSSSTATSSGETKSKDPATKGDKGPGGV